MTQGRIGGILSKQGVCRFHNKEMEMVIRVGRGGGAGCLECVRDVAAGKEGLMMFSMVGHQISMTNM